MWVCVGGNGENSAGGGFGGYFFLRGMERWERGGGVGSRGEDDVVLCLNLDSPDLDSRSTASERKVCRRG